MQRRHALALDGVAVLGRRVPHVRGELPARMQRIGAVHEAIAGDLGDDRGRRDRRRRGIAVDDRALRMADVPARRAVEPGTGSPGSATRTQRVVQRVEVRAVQAAARRSPVAQRETAATFTAVRMTIG